MMPNCLGFNTFVLNVFNTFVFGKDLEREWNIVEMPWALASRRQGQIPSQSISSQVILEKSFYISKTQFFLLWVGGDDNYFLGLLD